MATLLLSKTNNKFYKKQKHLACYFSIEHLPKYSKVLTNVFFTHVINSWQKALDTRIRKSFYYGFAYSHFSIWTGFEGEFFLFVRRDFFSLLDLRKQQNQFWNPHYLHFIIGGVQDDQIDLNSTENIFFFLNFFLPEKM